MIIQYAQYPRDKFNITVQILFLVLCSILYSLGGSIYEYYLSSRLWYLTILKFQIQFLEEHFIESFWSRELNCIFQTDRTLNYELSKIITYMFARTSRYGVPAILSYSTYRRPVLLITEYTVLMSF